MSKLNTEELLTKDKNERMWFFLKGCIPTERANVIFAMLNNINPDFVNNNGNIVVPGIPACAMLVDLVYTKNEEELIGLGVPAKYLEGMQIIKDSLEQYTTECYITEKYDEMTDGQKQLLNLAAVMAMQPSVLILDEPTGQLDPIAATDFLETVLRINRELGQMADSVTEVVYGIPLAVSTPVFAADERTKDVG